MRFEGASQLNINTSVSYINDTVDLYPYINNKKKDWIPKLNLHHGQKNILHPPLDKFQKILFPPLPIKLGLIETILKVINKKNQPSVSN